MDGVEQSKRGGVFVCDMGETSVRGRRSKGDGRQRWVAEGWRECSQGKGFAATEEGADMQLAAEVDPEFRSSNELVGELL